MKTIFISSPYTKGDQIFNVHRQMVVADILLENGFCPMIPLLNHFWETVSKHDYESYLKMDFEMIKRCDAILRLNGESIGADHEVEFARQCNKQIFNSVKEVLCQDVQ